MGYALQVFVSSTCHELRDLRASIKVWLEDLGIAPLMSEDEGFPHFDGMPPYATCLKTLEQCPMVIGVIDRQYGTPCHDWGPYPQYQGLAPTHAELRHALELGKRALIYVRDDTWRFYEVWRKNPNAFSGGAPNGLDEATLRMFEELQMRKPAPWLARFKDSGDLRQSLNREFVNQLYTYLHEREKETMDSAGYILGKIVDAAPEVKAKITAGLNPDLVADRDKLQQRLADIEVELEMTKGAAGETISKLERDKGEVAARLDVVANQLGQTSLLLARSAMKDASWLDFVRRTLMPKQPGRVPFHNSAEIALRGYHTAGGRRKPILSTVSWAKLLYNEGGLHRGFNAGIILEGDDFSPGVVWTQRRCGQTALPTGNADYFWRLPNIYFGDHLEVSASEDELEGPLSWRNHEFQVKNPEGGTSEWVTFAYPFDDDLLLKARDDSLLQGAKLLRSGRAAEAIEPLRKALVFSDRILGIQHYETLRIKDQWEYARNEAALAKLRFRVGDRLEIISGPHVGSVGVVDRLLLNHYHAYFIKTADEDAFYASDEQVATAR